MPKTNSRFTLSLALAQLLDEEEQHVWTEEEFNQARSELPPGETFKSGILLNAVHYGFGFKYPTPESTTPIQTIFPTIPQNAT